MDKWEKTRTWVLEGFLTVDALWKTHVVDKTAPDTRPDYQAVKKGLAAAVEKDLAKQLHLVGAPQPHWPANKTTVHAKVQLVKESLDPAVVEIIKPQPKGGRAEGQDWERN